jgi:hypothetical protein
MTVKAGEWLPRIPRVGMRGRFVVGARSEPTENVPILRVRLDELVMSALLGQFLAN